MENNTITITITQEQKELLERILKGASFVEKYQVKDGDVAEAYNLLEVIRTAQ